MLKKTFVHRGPLHCSPESVTFSMYSSQEIQKMSVVKVITPLAFNSLGHPLYAGLYDPRMGPFNTQGTCETCQETLLHCPGHFGHIEMPLPVINPLFSKTLLQIFRMTCLVCHAVTIPENAKNQAICQLQLLSRGLVQDALQVETNWSEKSKEDVESKLETFDFICQTYPAKEGESEVIKPTKNAENIRRQILRNVLANAKMSKKCPHCGTQCKKMMLYESKIVYILGSGPADDPMPGYEEEDKRKYAASQQKYLTPLEARDHLRLVWLKEKEFLVSLYPVLGLTDDGAPTDILFVDVVPVPPPKNRPAQMVNSIMVEHPQNLALRNVVSSCAMMIYALQALKNGVESLSAEAMRALKGVSGATMNDKLETLWKDLQLDVDHVMDRDKGTLNAAAAGQLMGLKQVIEKKEGLFRMHMMGKRVNHAARTVITPDPNIDIEEIGIPDVFARVLTLPVPVTPWNVHFLKQLVMNGPNVHPGAIAVENELGQVSRLDPKNENQRSGIANRLLVADSVGFKRSFKGVKTVYRHLQNGDLLLLNRQPSLHRPSIMAHRARVLYGDKVFRLHYANCKHYNADFDGDEMNAHFPQSLIARSEAASLVNVCNHFLVPKDGTPLGGLIQDHIVAAVRLTIRGRFFNYSDYQQLVYFALSNTTRPILTLPPTIIKPARLWSGKQVVSTIVLNLVPLGTYPPTFYSQAKIKSDEWKQPSAAKESPYSTNDKGLSHLSESSVVFRHGHLVSGVLDKVQLGATPYGLCHSFFELYGNRSVGDILSAFSRLLTNFLQWEGFTLGVKDVLVTAPADIERQKAIQLANKIGPEAAAAGVGLIGFHNEKLSAMEKLIAEKLEQAHRSPDPKSRAIVDQAYKQKLDGFTNQINRACLPFGLVTTFPYNNLQLLVQSGAKGSTVNTMQMSCLLGQIELEGKRPHLTISGKSLPSFKVYDTSPRAGGFITGRFLTGIRPQEFFFHCMAGREGLIDTAVKTSRSGYLQRCLVKLLEGVVTQYDGTVRDSDGSVIQFLYGEDGLDVGLSQYLKSKNLDFLRMNSHIILSSESLNKIRKMDYLGPQKVIHKAKKAIKQWKDINGNTVKQRHGPALAFFRSATNSKMKLQDVPEHMRTVGRSEETDKLIQHWRNLSDEAKTGFEKLYKHCPDPLLSRFKPDSNFGVISEQLETILESYKEDNNETEKTKKKNRKYLKEAVYYKALKALSAPGDAVGVLAAQSIGEPSTQMTLNTFHFAGRGEMNVTLGIPRLREILMVASANIRTPSMDIPFKPNVSLKKAEQLKLKLTRVTLAQVLQNVTVKEKVDTNLNRRLYSLKFQFLQEQDYSAQFYVKPSIILKYFEKVFIQKFCAGVRRLTNSSKSASSSIGTVTRKRKGDAEDGNGNDLDDGNVDEATKDLFDEMERKGMGEDHQSSDEEPDVEDEDATQSTRKARQGEREYEEPEEEDEDARDMKARDQDPELDSANSKDLKKKKKGKNAIFGTIAADEDDDEDEGSDTRKKVDAAEEEEVIDDDALFTVSEDHYDSRVATVMAVDDFVHDYDFDRVAEEHCTVTLKVSLFSERVNLANLLKDESGKAIIHQVKNINRAFTVTQGDKISLKTEGINILAMTHYQDLLELNKLHCNNIHTMADHYGIEAASRVIVKEMTDVFKAYGIVIDPRHLTIIADYMTFSGTYRPFNRIGIESSPSPLQQMSFETVVTFLRDAILGGRTDELQSPSGRLVLGKPVQTGTGSFQLINDLRC